MALFKHVIIVLAAASAFMPARTPSHGVTRLFAGTDYKNPTGAEPPAPPAPVAVAAEAEGEGEDGVGPKLALLQLKRRASLL